MFTRVNHLIIKDGYLFFVLYLDLELLLEELLRCLSLHGASYFQRLSLSCKLEICMFRE